MSIQHGLRRCNILLLASLLLTFLSSCENYDPWPSQTDNRPDDGSGGVVEPTIRLVAEGTGFQSIWASDRNNVYAVSHTGGIYHYDGRDWSFVETRAIGTHFNMSGTDSGRVAIVSDYYLLCLDQQGKEYLTLWADGDLIGAFFDDSSRVNVVSRNGEVKRCNDDRTWTVLVEGSGAYSLSDVCLTRRNILLAVGDGGLILRSSGGPWEQMISGGAVDLKAVSSGGNGIFAVGNEGLLLHYEDSEWQKVEVGTSAHLTDVWCSPGGDVFVTGRNSTLLRFRFGEWEKVNLGSLGWFSAVWGLDDDNVFVALGDYAGIFRYDGLRWRSEVQMTPCDFEGVWASSPNNIIAVGEGQIFNFDGLRWSRVYSSQDYTLHSVWGTSPSSVYAVGDGCILHYDGATWSPMSGEHEGHVYYSVHGTSDNDVYAVGRGGLINHFDGRGWLEMSSGTTEDLCGVWALSKFWVIAVGHRGTILRFHDLLWTAMLGGDQRWFTSVWSDTLGNAFAVCMDGSLFRNSVRYDNPWVRISSGGATGLSDIWGTVGFHFVAVGGGNVLLADRADLTLISGIGYRLKSVWGFSDNDWVAVGGGGSVVRRVR